eukprot:scaffold2576_cov116-Cylindrotheca_fusiformis.AAC.9
MDQNDKRKRVKREEETLTHRQVDSSIIEIDDGAFQNCKTLAQVTSIRRFVPETYSSSVVSEATYYNGDTAVHTMAEHHHVSYNELIELCTRYNVLGEDQQISKDVLQKLVIESAAAKAGRIFPAELPNDIKVMVLYCARQNGFTEPKLAQEA